jgi:hypothetical protein
VTIGLAVVAYQSGSLHDAEMDARLGHRNIQHTVRYTELSSGRFKDFWR